MGLPRELQGSQRQPPSREIPGRRIPAVLRMPELASLDLPTKAVPLPEANTLSHWYYYYATLGQMRGPAGLALLFVPQVVLVKFRSVPLVTALRIEKGQEFDGLAALRAR